MTAMAPQIELTAEQQAAADSRAPWTSVVAGPGAGKTSVLVERIYEVAMRRLEFPVLALVFTRAAAAEILGRMERRLSDWMLKQVRVATFHAYAAQQVLREPFRGRALRVATETESEVTVESLLAGVHAWPKRHRPGIRALERAIIAHEAEPVDTPYGNCIREVIDRLRDGMPGTNPGDEPNLVPTWDLVPKFLGREPTERFRHVIVDEAQDCTRNEAAMARMLLAPGGQLFTVGDPRQAIMGFRGAHAEAFLGDDDPHELPLSQTFRFGPAIANEANAILLHNGMGIEAAPVQSVVRSARLADAVRAGSVSTVILARKHHECAAVERMLGRDRAVHIQRDPYLLTESRDQFREVAESGRIPIGTVHAAKGREWDHVILHPSLRVRDRMEPEELRTAYVAVTRARSLLTWLEPEDFHEAWSRGR